MNNTSRIPRDQQDDTGKSAAFPIVGIGASAGGLEALTALLNHMPVDTGFGFVLVQHLDPQHESALTQLLSRATRLPVSEITEGLPVAPNHVYVIPPNTNLRIEGGILRLTPRPKSRTPNHPIDSFFESLAQDREDRALGVILSGTATDGTLGLEAIKGEGGITFAQDDSARYDSMPRSAIASGCVDFVLSPQNIATEIASIARHPYVVGRYSESLNPASRLSAHRDIPDRSPRQPEGTEAPRKARDNGYTKILVLLRNHSGVDFSLYKSTTIERRIARRMLLSKLNTLEDYAAFLRNNLKELDALYSDALISVTNFFRNPETFDILKRKVFPRLLEQRSDDPIRVWVLGCSTGQEAYSLAMIFAEAMDNAPRMRKLQVFATDLNNTVLDKARQGFYSRSITQGVTPERLRRFFVEQDGGYCINKSLREMIVFARQNLINDPPFSRLDLISCRNVLIYLEPSLQRKAISTFHYALNPEGVLFLGAAESIGNYTDLFEPSGKANRIYFKKAAPTRSFPLPVRRTPVEPAPGGHSRKGKTPQDDAGESTRGELNAQREADRVAIQRYAPPGVLIDGDFQILQFRGSTDSYLQTPAGKANFNVLKMARDGLMLSLRTVIETAKREQKVARVENVRMRQGNKIRAANIEVIPLKNLKEPCFLVVFEDAMPARIHDARALPDKAESFQSEGSSSEDDASHIAGLESELNEAREYLQSVQERQEAVNEELQASNEEVQSANEELQSINEELETSKEELESANEELTTINEEMNCRNTELSRLNSDLVNIQTSARLAIVLLGRDLTIRRFSNQAEKQFNLIAADVGRPFSHVRHGLVWDVEANVPGDLDSFIEGVIGEIREQEREVRDTEGRWYSLRVRPYLTVDNKVDGAVLVLVDITNLKNTEQAVAEARDYAEAIIRTARHPLVILNSELRVYTANEAFYEAFHTNAAETVGRLIYELSNSQWHLATLRQLLEDVLPRHTFFQDFEFTFSIDGVGQRNMLLNGRQLNVNLQPARILLGFQDVTDLMHFQAAAHEEAEKFKVLFDRSPLPKWTIDPTTLRFLNVNQAAIRLYGYSLEEFLRMNLPELDPPENEAVQGALARTPSYLPERLTTRHRKRNGDIIDVEVRSSEIVFAGSQTWIVSATDITELKRAEQALRSINNQLFNELAATQQLQQTSTQLIQEDKPDALYQQTLNAAVTIMHADMASIQMVDDERNALRLLASQGFEPDFAEIFGWVGLNTITSCNAARKEGRRVIIRDVETYESLIGTPDLENHRKMGIRAIQSTPLISRDGWVIGVISTHWRNPYQPAESDLRLLDILARQAADLIERKKAEEALREADRRKNEFLAMLAHELRTPLSPIRNALEIMRRTESSTDVVRDAVAMMGRQVHQMVRLVDDLLDVSRISHGNIELRLGRIELASVLNHAIESIRPFLESKELQFTVTLPQKPVYVNGDPIRLAQAIANLLNNAGKFTDRGGRVWLSAEVNERSEQVAIRVRDTGIGIDASQFPRIFEMFTQLDTSLERVQGGLGIGLALTKALAELHGGKLEVESAGRGQGSEFVMRLPILAEAPFPLPVARIPVPAVTLALRILVVDDNPDSAESLRMLLAMEGNETRTACDGLQALEMAETFRPDVILLDIGLPKLSGYDVARRIREQAWGKRIALAALTGWGQDTDRQKAHDAGFDVHFVKPVDYDLLTHFLAGLQPR